MSEPLLLQDIDEPGLHTLAVYERRGGFQALRKALAMTPAEVLSELEASGLRGRGGAGFQMGKKVSFLPHGAVERYLVCNADESEPGTFKDRELMQKAPHMLLARDARAGRQSTRDTRPRHPALPRSGAAGCTWRRDRCATARPS